MAARYRRTSIQTRVHAYKTFEMYSKSPFSEEKSLAFSANTNGHRSGMVLEVLPKWYFWYDADTGYREPKRDSATTTSGSAYSRSYQSVFSEPAFHHRHWSNASSRPFTADPSIAESYPDEDPQELAAAVGLLSCSYGTPRTGPTGMPSDVPPVPPLPEKYASRKYSRQEDVIMDGDSSDEDHHHRAHNAGRLQHDDFDGVFGRMDY